MPQYYYVKEISRNNKHLKGEKILTIYHSPRDSQDDKIYPEHF